MDVDVKVGSDCTWGPQRSHKFRDCRRNSLHPPNLWEWMCQQRCWTRQRPLAKKASNLVRVARNSVAFEQFRCCTTSANSCGRLVNNICCVTTWRKNTFKDFSPVSSQCRVLTFKSGGHQDSWYTAALQDAVRCGGMPKRKTRHSQVWARLVVSAGRGFFSSFETGILTHELHRSSVLPRNVWLTARLKTQAGLV